MHRHVYRAEGESWPGRGEMDGPHSTWEWPGKPAHGEQQMVSKYVFSEPPPVRGSVEDLWVRLAGLGSWLGLFSAPGRGRALPVSLFAKWREQWYLPPSALWGSSGTETNTPTSLA